MTSIARPLKSFGLVSMVALGLALVACASKSEKAATCVQRDWYELGRRDGYQGAVLDRLNTYKQECGAEFSNDFATVYMNGRNAGLVEYCLPENAYELGRMGLTYTYVCPSTMEPQFLSSYRKGQQARLLQIKKRELDTKIESLTDQILQTTSGSFENRQMQSELNQLKRLRAANERELEAVSK